MASQKKFELTPLPLETEFKVLSVRRRLKNLSREELEEFLTESLSLLTKLTHQVTQMKDYLLEVEEGKIE